jgi:D-3-phosphoglycerate dehydrogenase
MVLAERMGSLLSQTAPGRMHGVSIRYYGPLVTAHADLLASAVVAGVLRPMLFESVTIVNARAVAADRGIEIVESRSSRVRHYANMLSVKLQTAGGERWIEGTVFEGSSPRLTLLDGVEIEAPLGGTLILIANNDQPGVIGEVGTILGRHGINIASFALGRSEGGAAAVVRIDADGGDRTRAIEALRGATAIKEVRLVTLEPVDV